MGMGSCEVGGWRGIVWVVVVMMGLMDLLSFYCSL